MNAAGRRELQRCVLEALVSMRGHGWASAADLAARMQILEHDGRRVAGALRRLANEGLVERQDFREVREKFVRGKAPRLELMGPALDYRITDAGATHLAALERNVPRLTDAAPRRQASTRTWPRTSRLPRPRHR